MFELNRVLVLFVISLQLACLSTGNVVRPNSKGPDVQAVDNTAPTANSSNNTPRNRVEYVVYTNVLRTVFYNRKEIGSFGNDSFDAMGARDLLLYKKRMVSIDKSDIPESLGGVDPETLSDFKRVVGEPEDLRDAYDVKASLLAVEGAKNLDELLLRQKQKLPDAKAIVGLSRLGFNSSKTQALLYLEYFGSERHLQRSFVVVPISYVSRPDGAGDSIEINSAAITAIPL